MLCRTLWTGGNGGRKTEVNKETPPGNPCGVSIHFLKHISTVCRKTAEMSRRGSPAIFRQMRVKGWKLMAVKETLQPPLHGLLDNPGALASMVERTGPTPRASSPRRTCGTSRRSAGRRRRSGSPPPAGCGPAPGDTGVFRERGRTVGICRVEKATGSTQEQTGIASKAGE